MSKLSKVHLRRFANLIRATEEADPWRFTMRQIAHDCQTPACVLGNYAARRDLQRVFRLGVVKQLDDGGVIVGLSSAGHGVYFADNEVCSHFGIEPSEADMMFSSQGCNSATTPKAAAAFIRRFVERKQREV